MSMEFKRKLPIPMEIKKEYPISERAMEIKKERDQLIKDVITGKSDKFLVIIGPCSADNRPAVLDYVNRLAKVQEMVKDRIVIVPRVYTGKPRTTGEGYKGLLHQPDPEKAPDMLKGLVAIRKMHMDVIEQTGLATADEMLYPENYRYLDDILSYVAVGARSVEDQHHRMTASGMDIPVGMKNPTSGDLTVMMNSVTAAQCGHDFIFRGWEVSTKGNPLAHAILRGATNKRGQCIPNYHYEDLIFLQQLYSQKEYQNPAVVVDTNHSNSNKQFKEQIRIAKEILHSRKESGDICRLVKGLMMESYIEGGCQKIGEGIYGKSITDPCLGWEDTERLLLEMAELV